MAAGQEVNIREVVPLGSNRTQTEGNKMGSKRLAGATTPKGITTVQEEGKAAYLRHLNGVGTPVAAPLPSREQNQQRMVEAFKLLGLTDEQAAIAARGREPLFESQPLLEVGDCSSESIKVNLAQAGAILFGEGTRAAKAFAKGRG